jgi:hypothetical protein
MSDQQRCIVEGCSFFAINNEDKKCTGCAKRTPAVVAEEAKKMMEVRAVYPPASDAEMKLLRDDVEEWCATVAAAFERFVPFVYLTAIQARVLWQCAKAAGATDYRIEHVLCSRVIDKNELREGWGVEGYYHQVGSPTDGGVQYFRVQVACSSPAPAAAAAADPLGLY